MATESALLRQSNYSCQDCDYTCYKKSEWVRHISTSKHINATQCYIKATDNKHACDNCNKKFIHHSSYYRHKKKCMHPPVLQEKPPSEVHRSSVLSVDIILQTQTNLILELVKQNQEFKDLLIQQSNQMMVQNKTMIDVAKNQGNNNNNTLNHTHTHPPHTHRHLAHHKERV